MLFDIKQPTKSAKAIEQSRVIAASLAKQTTASTATATASATR